MSCYQCYESSQLTGKSTADLLDVFPLDQMLDRRGNVLLDKDLLHLGWTPGSAPWLVACIFPPLAAGGVALDRDSLGLYSAALQLPLIGLGVILVILHNLSDALVHQFSDKGQMQQRMKQGSRHNITHSALAPNLVLTRFHDVDRLRRGPLPASWCRESSSQDLSLIHI